MQLGWSKPLSTVSRGALSMMMGIVMVIVVILSYQIDVRTSPGQLSAVQLRGESLGGFDSHAEFHHECERCHTPLYSVSADRCLECHVEIVAERNEGITLHGLLPGTDTCQNCHIEHQGQDAVISALPLANIDHERLTGFSLIHHQECEQGGAPATCSDCHRQHRFAAEWVDCITCHTETDPGFTAEHTERFGEECFDCHDGHDRMVDFAHNSIFLLDGAHDGVECEGCHADQVFAGTPRECTACHEEPDVHVGDFGLDCSRCHTALAWAPAELTRHVFFLDHGDEGYLDCERCHVASYVEYTCYDCHEPDEMQIDHITVSDRDGKPVTELEECIECHPTGQAGEAEQIYDSQVEISGSSVRA